MNDRVIPVIVMCVFISYLGYACRQGDGGYAPDIILAQADSDASVPLGARALLLGQKLDINTVTAGDLKQIPRLSWKVAHAIVAYQQAHGHQLKTVDELINVKGVGVKTLEKLKVYAEVKSPQH